MTDILPNPFEASPVSAQKDRDILPNPFAKQEILPNPFEAVQQAAPTDDFFSSPEYLALSAQQAEQPDANYEGGFFPSVARGSLNIAGSVLNLVGAEETGKELQEYAQQEFPGTVDYTDLEGPGDYVQALKEATGELLPSAAAFAAGAKGGAVIGGAVGAAPGAAIGAVIGGFTSAFILNAGETKDTLQAEGVEATPERIITGGLVKAIPDAIPGLYYLKKLGLTGLVDDAVEAAAVKSGLIADLAQKFPILQTKTAGAIKGLAAVEAIEPATETFQTFVDQAIVNVANGIDALDLSDEQKNELKSTAIMTAFGVAPLGAGGGAIAQARENRLRETEEGELPLITEPTEKPVTSEDLLYQLNALYTGFEEAAEADVGTVTEAGVLPGSTRGELASIEDHLEPIDIFEVGFKARPVAHSNNPEYVGQTIQDIIGQMKGGEVVVDGFDVPLVSGSLHETYDGKIQEWQNRADEAKAAGSEISAEFYQQQADKFRKAKTEQETVRNEATQLIENWVKEFAPNLKVILTDGQLYQAMSEVYPNLTPGHEFGSAFSLGDNVSIIQLSPHASRRVGTDAPFWGYEGTLDRHTAYATLGHEFGHVLHQQVLQGESPAVKKAIHNEYIQWLNDIQNLTIREFSRKYGSIPKALRQSRMGALNQDQKIVDHLKALSAAYRKQGSSRILADYKASYLPSFSEYLAEQTSRYMQQSKRGQGILEKVYAKMVQVLRRFFNRHKGEFAPNTNFANWMESLALKVEMENLKNLEAKMPKTADGKINKVVKDLKIARDTLEADGSGLAEKDNIARAKFNWFGRTFGSLLQVGQENKDVPGVARYIDAVRNWWTEKTQWTNEAVKVMELWESKIKGKRDNQNFSNALYQITLESEEEGKLLAPERIAEILKENGVVSEGAMEVIQAIQKQFTNSLDAFYAVLEADARRRLRDNKTVLQQKLQEYAKEKAKLMNRNYFPLTRFGEYWVQVKAARNIVIDGVQYKGGETIRFEMFESDRARAQGLKEAQRKFGTKNVINSSGKVSEELKAFRGIPPQLLQAIADRTELTESQREELQLLLHELAPGQSYRKHLLHRKGTAGYSLDAKRTFSNYFMHFANHISRINNSTALNDALDSLKAYRDLLEKKQGVTSTKETDLLDYLRRHYEYAMNPGEEWANLRSVGFLWYLGFMPKSAFINLTQIPLVTFPYLAARHGDAKAVKYLTTAMKDVRRVWTKGGDLESALGQAIEQGIQAGILDESLATELAAVAEGSNLSRLVPGTFLRSERGAKYLRNAAHWGSWLFQKAEKVNRFQTFAAAWRLSIDQQLGKGHSDKTRQAALSAMTEEARQVILQEAFTEARNATEQTQYEYARWNRPEFMRGKKSVIFLFWQYMQNTLYFAARDPGRVRFMLMMLVMAGAMGFPFAEDIFDLVDFAGTKMKSALGLKNPRVDLRQDAREFVQELGANPDLIMHGISRYSFGLPWVAEQMGISASIPNVDASGSLSMGRIIPGVEPILGREGKLGDRFLASSEDIGGAFVSIPLAIMRAIADDNPDVFKRWERALPSAMRSVSRAQRYYTEGKETTRTGATLEEFDVKDPEQLAEIVAQGLGFLPTRISEERELRWAQREAANFYTTRRTMLMRQFDYARRAGDAQGIADMRKAIRSFNSTVPVGSLKISGEDLMRSIKSRATTIAMEERGLPTSKREIPLYRQVEEDFRPR